MYDIYGNAALKLKFQDEKQYCKEWHDAFFL